MALIFTLMTLSACESCSRLIPASNKLNIAQAGEARKIALEDIFSKTQDFQLLADLSIELSHNESTKKNQESIELLGKNGFAWLKKKSDEVHFFEIMKDAEEKFYVKSKVGAWRLANGNKSFYNGHFEDALNLLPWLMEEFSLKGVWEKRGKDLEVMELAMPFDPEAPFLTKIKARAEDFNEISQSMVTAKMTKSIKSGLILDADIVISITSKDLRNFNLKATWQLDPNARLAAIAVPDLESDEQILYPVNVVSGFNELLREEKKD